MRKLHILIIVLVFFITNAFRCSDKVAVNKETEDVSKVQVSQETKDKELFAAIEAKDRDKVEKLIKNGANPNSTQKSDVFHNELATPLKMAVLNKNFEIVELLLKHNANPNVGMWKCDENYENCKPEALLWTTLYDVPIATILVAYGAKVENELIHRLHGARNEKAVAFLVKQGVDINYRRGGNGLTALMLNAQWGNIDLVKTLLKYGADVSIKDEGGATALYYAHYSSTHRGEMIKIIKEALKKEEAHKKEKRKIKLLKH